MYGLFCCQSSLDGRDVDDLCFEAAPSRCSEEDGFASDWPHACKSFARDDDNEYEGRELAGMKQGPAASRLSESRSLSRKRSSKSADGGSRNPDGSNADQNSNSPNARGGERDPLILSDRSRSRHDARYGGEVKVKLVSVESARLAALKERRADRLRQSKEWEEQYHVVKENLRKIFASVAITAHCADPSPCEESQAPMPAVGFPIMPEAADLQYSQYSYASPSAEEVVKQHVDDDALPDCHPEDAMPVSAANLVLQINPELFVDKGDGDARHPGTHGSAVTEAVKVTSI